MEWLVLESKVYADDTGKNDRALPVTFDENGSVTKEVVGIPGGVHLSNSSEADKQGSVKE